MSEEIKKTEWARIIKFYQQVDGAGQNEIETQLAEKIAASDYSKSLFPYTSHRTLCLSPSIEFDKFHLFPMISIKHLGNKIFRVEYWQIFWRERERRVYEVDESRLWQLLESLFLRLNIEIT